LTVAKLFDQRFDVTSSSSASVNSRSKSWRLRIRIRRCRPELDSEDSSSSFGFVKVVVQSVERVRRTVDHGALIPRCHRQKIGIVTLSHHDTGQEVSTGTYVRCDPFVHFDATFVKHSIFGMFAHHLERHVLDNGFVTLSIPFPSHDERSLAYAESKFRRGHLTDGFSSLMKLAESSFIVRDGSFTVRQI
jgi:hypothetical protein